MYGITINDRFDAAHRVPVIGGKCLNLHGHNWGYQITVVSLDLVSGMVVEFGEFKRRIRSWVDEALDHATLLAASDPLIPALEADGTKLYRFGALAPSAAEEYARGLSWPTAECLAGVLTRLAKDALAGCQDAAGVRGQARVSQVTVQETPANIGFWVDDSVAGGVARLDLLTAGV